MNKRIVAFVTLIAAAACARHEPVGTQTPSPIQTLLIESKGVTMPLSLAVPSLAFRPFIPKRVRIVQSALIPPLNVKQQKNHGLAIEYISGENALLLSQWPRGSDEALIGSSDLAARPCAPVAYESDGLMWSTRSGLVMTLVPQESVRPTLLTREARRLIRDGACEAGG
jgi:hypothetical protein